MTLSLPVHSPVRWPIVLLVALITMLAVPAAAGADIITSENWSGYAAHENGVRFTRVTATWRQPAAICTAGTDTYSAFWVGIGGYKLSSDAMEQIGSELDCNANGTQSLFAWYELVPAPSRTIHMTIAGGDLLTAAVRISGKQVTLTLADTTRDESFAKTVTDRTIDATSAEWITEAPSECTTATKCETLPLADFGAVHFANASAETAAGRTAAIASSMWKTTKILLGYSSNGTGFVAKTTTAKATPSVLNLHGHSFRVEYSGAAVTTTSGAGSSGSGGSGASGSGGSGSAGSGSPGTGPGLGGSGSGGNGGGGGPGPGGGRGGGGGGGPGG
jgi:hypothetical protein